MACELCNSTGGKLLWRDNACRVVLVSDPDYPGFCRVIWNSHKKEMTDLTKSQRLHVMRVVFAVEEALRRALCPDKINLASLGNMTPHLHWHVIPRFLSDRHFPHPIWGRPMRKTSQTAPRKKAQNLKPAMARALAKKR